MPHSAKKVSVPPQVPAASRTIAILRLLSRSPEPLTLSEISATLEILPSTCLQILRVLVAESLVAIERPGKRYRLGIGILPLARSVLARDVLIDFFRMEVVALANRFRLSTVATKIEGDRAISVAACVPSHIFAINTEVGSRFPVFMGGTGRCVAAFGDADPQEMARLIHVGAWARQPQPDEWLAQVEECRRVGYTVDREQYIAGVTVVAAPVLDAQGSLTHTLGIVGITQTVEEIGPRTLGTALMEVGKEALKLAESRTFQVEGK